MASSRAKSPECCDRQHGKVQWKTQGQSAFPQQGQTVEFQLAAGTDWQDVNLKLPIKGTLAIVRLYLPATKSPVEIESIRDVPVNSNKPIRAWNFHKVKP